MKSINIVKLKEIASIKMGYSFRSRIERDKQGNVSVIQMKDIAENGLLDSTDLARVQIPDIDEHHLIKVDDIIFRSRGQTTTSALVNQDLGGAVATAPLIRIRVYSKHVLPAYLAWYINQPSTQAYLSSHARGTSVLMIGIEDIGQMEVAIPPRERQRQIIELSKLAEKEQELLRLLSLKRAQYLNHILIQMTTEKN